MSDTRSVNNTYHRQHTGVFTVFSWHTLSFTISELVTSGDIFHIALYKRNLSGFKLLMKPEFNGASKQNDLATANPFQISSRQRDDKYTRPPHARLKR